VSTTSFSNFVQSVGHLFTTSPGLRFVYHPRCCGTWADLPSMLSGFSDVIPVTLYTPAVFDAFVSQTKVSPSVRLS
jgi:hypothetical protein